MYVCIIDLESLGEVAVYAAILDDIFYLCLSNLRDWATYISLVGPLYARKFMRNYIT